MLKSRAMSFRRVHRSLLSGLLLAALLLQSLLPAMAGLRAAQGAQWIEVCVSSGIRWVKVDASAATTVQAAADPSADTSAAHPPATPHATAHQDHCVLCAATGAAPEFDAHRYLPLAVATVARPSLVVSPVSAFPGHALQSRAPPVFS